MTEPTLTTDFCDCERGHNGLGMVGRECDCDCDWFAAAPRGVLRPPIVQDQAVWVDMGDGASMTMPRGRLEWNLRYGNPEAVRYDAASVVETFRYLVLECNRDEAWRRIKLMRDAMKGVRDDE